MKDCMLVRHFLNAGLKLLDLVCCLILWAGVLVGGFIGYRFDHIFIGVLIGFVVSYVFLLFSIPISAGILTLSKDVGAIKKMLAAEQSSAENANSV